MLNAGNLRKKLFKLGYRLRHYPRILLPNTVPIVVYTMAKVASSSVRVSLYRHNIGPVFWAHQMLPANVEEMRVRRQERNLRPFFRPFPSYLYKNYVQKDQPMRFVTLVRDPVARNLSIFFQAYEYHAGANYKDSELSVDELIDRFFDGLLHELPLEWFDKEFKATTGIDVYSYPFDHEKGYTIIKEGRFDLLILKVETSDEAKASGLGEFFEIPDFTLYHHNIGDNKEYADTYKKFKNRLELPTEYINHMYQSKYIQHFYTEAEQTDFRKHWLGEAE